jgi:hypothetical protein
LSEDEPHQAPFIGPDQIERVIDAGRQRVVIDLFQGAGPVRVGTLIHDFEQRYRVELVLVGETLYGGARVLAGMDHQADRPVSDDA